MTRAWLIGGAAVLMGGTATAADLPRRAAPVAPVPVFVSLPFDGVYTGFGIGIMSTRASVRQPFSSGRYDSDGTTGITILGRDWQFGSFVAGIQGEFGIHETKGRLRPFPTTGAEGDQLWSAGIKARFGYAFGSILPYVSAGVATTQFHQHSVFFKDDGDVNRHFGFTVGAGVDVAWTRNFTTRLEYEYASYGREGYLHDGVRSRVELDSHTVKLAAIFREVPGSGPAGTLTPGRSGSYGGLLAAYAFADTTFKRPNGLRTTSEPDGFEGGIFGGTDFNFGSFFVGFDSDVTASSLKDTGVGLAGTIRTEVLWTSTVRGRIGTTFGAFSPYVAAGVSLAQIETTNLVTRNLDINMAYGGTAAVGVDYALTDRWFTRLEYAYTRYQDSKARIDGFSNNRDLDRHDVRIGLGYRLGDRFSFF